MLVEWLLLGQRSDRQKRSALRARQLAVALLLVGKHYQGLLAELLDDRLVQHCSLEPKHDLLQLLIEYELEEDWKEQRLDQVLLRRKLGDEDDDGLLQQDGHGRLRR